MFCGKCYHLKICKVCAVNNGDANLGVICIDIDECVTKALVPSLMAYRGTI